MPVVEMFVLIDVDNILVTCSKATAIKGLLHNMCSALSIKDLETINYFLGIEATIQPDGLLLSQ